MTIETRKVKPLATRAAVGSIDAAKRTVDVVWTTGAKVLRSSWFDGPFYEELSLDPAHVRLGRLNNGAPFLANHDGYDVARTLGVVESARLEGAQGVATVRFARAEDDPEADKVFRKIADGIIQNVSVGYRVHKTEKIEGGDSQIPTFRVVDWEPFEISAVAMGADDGAGFRALELNDVQITRTTRGASTMTEEEKRAAAELELRKQAEALKAAAETAARQERERMLGIRAAVRAAKLGEDLAEKLVNEGVSLDSARATVLEEMARRSDELPPSPTGHLGVTGGTDAGEKFARAAVSALLLATVPTLVRAAKKAGVAEFAEVDEGPNEMRKHSISDIAREALELQGVKTRGMSRETLAGRAFTTRAGPYAGTADFPTLLENVMGKILLGAYATTPDTWSRVCKVESVSDFRTSPRYRSGSLSVLDSLTENGEFKNKAIPDGAKLTISTATKGNIVAVSRQLLINDDMGALSDLLTKMGRAARLSIEVDFYALLAQNGGLGPTVGANPFFHSTNGNVNATGSAISVAGIDADRVVMLAQKDAQANEYLDVRPEILLVPSSLEAAARVINTSTFDHDSTKLQRPNPMQNLFRDVIGTPRLTGTRRYLFANPDLIPAFVVAFLNGQQSPTLESDLGWRVDGTEMKVRLDYLVQAFDVKGALTNAGA